MTTKSRDLEVLREWHDALNAGDTVRLDAVLHPDVEVAGPRGSGYGKALMREWVERAGIQLEPQRWFHGDGVAVVEQQARWRDNQTGQIGPAQTVASTFHLRDGMVARISRHDTLENALAEAGLTASAEVNANSQ